MPAVKRVRWKHPDIVTEMPAIPVPVTAELLSVTIDIGEPALSSSRQQDVGPVIQSLHQWPNLYSITLEGCLPLDGAGNILSTYPGTQLLSLTLTACGIDDEQLQRLMQAPFATRLISLTLSMHSSSPRGNSFTRLGVAAVASACTGLTELVLAKSFFSHPDGYSLEVARGNMPNLRRLNFAGSEITAIDMQRLAHVEWNDLKYLDLTKAQITSDGVAAWATAAWCGSLAMLDLSGCYIRDEGIIELVRANFKSLLTLHLDDNELGPMGVTTLAANAARFPLLQRLHLDGAGSLDAATLEAVATAPWNKHLSHLSLIDCHIEDDGLDGLARGAFPAMKELFLVGATITADDLIRFCSMAKGKYPALTSLYLSPTWVEPVNWRFAADCMRTVLRGRMMDAA
jgi:Leucine Rich repeat